MASIIDGPDQITAGCAALARTCPRMEHAIGIVGEVPVRRRPEGFDQVLSAVVSQQVSVASARAIWARLESAGMTAPAPIIAASDEDLRALGLSRQKVRYARALAEAGIDFDTLRGASDADVVKTLTAVTGIGPWTAQIYGMFSLGRADMFAPADLALQEGARMLYELPDRPTAKALEAMAQAWSPWRAVAARVLWAYYHVEKQREGIG